MRFTLHAFRLLLLESVVRAESLTGAAQVLRGLVSALSQQIAALEREVGCPVLQRHARGVLPTEAGAALIARAARRLPQGHLLSAGPRLKPALRHEAWMGLLDT